MARPQKQTVDYFPHDSFACTGDTLTVLQSRFGNDGYAFWFKLLEKLASTEGHYLDCRNSTKWQLLLAKTGVDELTGVEIMNLLVEMQAIDKDLWQSKLIWCQKLVDNISDVYKNRRREIPQKPVPTENNRITTSDIPIITGSTPVEIPQSKLKESKLKETKVDATTTSFTAYKEKLRVRYPELDLDEQWEECQIWYRDHHKKIKSPSLALGNWCKKEREIRKQQPNGTQRGSKGQLPTDDPDKYIKGKYGHIVQR